MLVIQAVIPQDPVLFSGSIRSNLDPFKRFNDAEIWESLRRTLLHDCIKSLDDVVAEVIFVSNFTNLITFSTQIYLYLLLSIPSNKYN